MALFDAFHKRRAIKAFSKRLGPALSARYGHTSHYSAEQISDVVDSPKFRRHREYLVYAYCLFMAEKDFGALGGSAHAGGDYQSLRIEAYDVIGPGASLAQSGVGTVGDAFQGPSPSDFDGGGGDAGM